MESSTRESVWAIIGLGCASIAPLPLCFGLTFFIDINNSTMPAGDAANLQVALAVTGVISLIAILSSIAGLREIARSQKTVRGQGKAQAGLLLGIIILVIAIGLSAEFA